MALAESLAMSRRGAAWLALSLAVALSAGCATTDWALSGKVVAPRPVCQLAATWQNNVTFTADTANNGKMMAGMAGRLYLFDSDVKNPPLVGDGSLVAELCDDTHQDPTPLEHWEIDAATLKRLAKRDVIGWGYTLYLPWTKRDPDLTKLSKVKLRLRYQPVKGSPVFTENVVTLSPMNGNVNVQQGGPPMVLPQIKR